MPLSQEIRVDNFCFNLGTSSFTIFCILLLQSESSQINFTHSSNNFLSRPFPLLPPVPGLQVFTNWCPDGWHDHATAVVWHLDNPSSENITWDSITQSYTKHRPDHKPLHPTQPQLVCNSKVSSLCHCYSSQKSLLSFGPTINMLLPKSSWGRLVIIAKGFLKLPILLMLIKQKSLSLPWNFALMTFRKLLIEFNASHKKGKSAIHSLLKPEWSTRWLPR